MKNPTWYVCEVCGYRTTSAKNLRLHQVVHARTT